MWLHAPILPSFPVFLCMHITIFIFNLFRRRLSIPDTELTMFVFEKNGPLVSSEFTFKGAHTAEKYQIL